MDNIKDNNHVKVSIYEQEYTVKAQADPEYIKNVAKYVDEKMEEVERSLPNKQSSLRIAILASMNITDELFNINRQNNEIIDAVAKKTNILIESIDKEIEKK